MRIALYHNLPSGGAKRHTYEQVLRLTRAGHKVVEFALSTADLSFCSLAPLVEQQMVFEFGGIGPLARRIALLTPYVHVAQLLVGLGRLRRINELVARTMDAVGEYDVVLVKDCLITHSPYLLRYLRTPSVFQCHDVRRPDTVAIPETPRGTVERLKYAYYAPARTITQHALRRVEHNNIRAATRVLTNSEYSRRVLHHRFGVDAGVIYPGVDGGRFRPLRVPHEDYVLAVGALHYMKGYRFLVDAIGCIPRHRRPPLLIVANSREGPEEQAVRALAAERGVDLRVETIRDDDRLVQVYNQARLFVYAPLQEALGMAPLEAMACGTPVLAVGEGGVLETVREGSGGITVPRDPMVFAETLDALLCDEARLRRLGAVGREYVLSNWTWDRAVDELERHLREVAKQHDGRP